MKNIIFILLFCAGIVHAQIINIPDANFKAKLLAASPSNQIAALYVNTDGGGASGFSKIDSNNDGEIQFSEALEIEYLNITNSPNIDNFLGLESFTNLKKLRVVNCMASEIDVSNLINLLFLELVTNSLTNINVSNLINLKSLSLDQNLFSNINTLNLPNSLKHFSCSYNFISNLNLSSLTNLESVSCNNNNSLTYVNINNLNLLNNINCSNTNIQEIDLSLCPQLTYFLSNFSNNPNLQKINLKNGTSDFTITTSSLQQRFLNLPSLQYVCIDDNLAELNQIVTAINNPNVNINSYCSFTPGGSYNTITGATTYAQNGSCTSSVPISNLKLNLDNNLGDNVQTFSSNGVYNFYTFTGNFNFEPQFENPSYFNSTPVNDSQTFTNNNNNVATHNFCISANGIKNDVEVVLTPTVPARPGFDAHYRLVFKNKGNQTLSGTIVLNFDNARLDFVSSNPATTNQQPSTLSWNYTNILPFENRAIDIILNVNSPQETPAVNIGDVLPFTTIINPVTGDEIPTDNTFALNQIVVGAYDPNDITCLQGETVDPVYIGQFLHYQIRFENTGNFPAENVVVAYFVNTNDYDLNTLQILNTSHNQLYTRITGNKIEFIFEDINLAPSAGGGGHGTIIIKMKTKNNLVVGDAVAKQANIYFDYNFPIETNEAETTFATLSIGDTLQLNEVSIYPNPTQDILNIKTKTSIKKVELFDIQGRLLQTHFHNSLETTLNVQKYNSGTYFVKVYTENGVGTQKVVKE